MFGQVIWWIKKYLFPEEEQFTAEEKIEIDQTLEKFYESELNNNKDWYKESDLHHKNLKEALREVLEKLKSAKETKSTCQLI